jgi:hypothetical protein
MGELLASLVKAKTKDVNENSQCWPETARTAAEGVSISQRDLTSQSWCFLPLQATLHCRLQTRW